MKLFNALNEHELMVIHGGGAWDVVKDVVGGAGGGAVIGAGRGAIAGLPLAPATGGGSILGSAGTGAVIGAAFGAGKAIINHW